MIQDDEVPPGDLEAIEIFAREFRLKDVVVDDVRRPARGVGVPEANLADGAVLSEDVVHVFLAYLVREALDEQDAVDLGRDAHPYAARRNSARRRRHFSL